MFVDSRRCSILRDLWPLGYPLAPYQHSRGNFGRALKRGHWIPLAPYQHSRGNFGRALINFLCIFSGFDNCGIYLVTSPACTFAHPFVIHHVCGFLSRHMSRAKGARAPNLYISSDHTCPGQKGPGPPALAASSKTVSHYAPRHVPHGCLK